MDVNDYDPAEIGLVRWLRSLKPRTKEAVYLWLLTGDSSLLIIEFTHLRLRAAA